MDNTPLEPGALKMSVGDFFKHLEEKHLSKKGLMLRLVVPPAEINQLADALKQPCEAMILPPAQGSTDGWLLSEICQTLCSSPPQCDDATVFLRCFDGTYYASRRIGHPSTGKSEGYHGK